MNCVDLVVWCVAVCVFYIGLSDEVKEGLNHILKEVLGCLIK